MTKSKQQASPVALVTGAAHGIGFEIAKLLKSRGYRVALADKDEHRLKSAADSLRSPGDILLCAADVSKETEVRDLIGRTIEEWGRLDLLVNNAARADPSNPAVTELSLESWNSYLAVNLTGVFLCVKHALPELRKTGGNIVNISSTRALMSEPNTEAYAATKGGLEALTHALAISCGPNVRVNAIRPGWIDTRDDDSPLSDKAHKQHPVGRVGRPEDIANMVAWLASDEASFVTGQILTVDGGMTRKMIYED